MEITIKIPDGEYCNGCKFLNYYTHRLVDMMGNETGNVREGYECKYYNCHLEIDKEHPGGCGCIICDNIKKDMWCKMTESQKLVYGTLFAAMALNFINGNKQCEKEENNEED